MQLKQDRRIFNIFTIIISLLFAMFLSLLLSLLLDKDFVEVYQKAIWSMLPFSFLFRTIVNIVNKISYNKMPITPFTIIGFYIDQLETLKVINNAIHKGKEIQVDSKPGGSYYKLAYPEGIEIWVGVNARKRIENVLPFFKGKNINTLEIMCPINDPKSPYRGAFSAWAWKSREKDEELPIVFDAPDYLMHAGDNFPKTAKVSLTAFASQIKVFESKEDFFLDDEDEFPSTTSFISGGISKFSTEEKEKPEAYAVFTGTVQSAKLIENPETLMNFYWISVESLNIDIDVVADKRMLKSIPKKGNIVRVSAWIVGDFIEHDEEDCELC